MKLSRRERFLTGLLLLVIIWVMAFRFLIAPRYGTFLYTRQVMEEMEQEKAEMDLYLVNYPDLEERLEGMRDKKVQEDFFYRNTETVFIDQKLQAMAEDAGVKLQRMSIGEPSPVELPVPEVGSFKERLFMERVVTMEVESPDVMGVMRFADGVYRVDQSLVVSYVDMMGGTETGTAGEAAGTEMKGIVEVRFYYEETR